MDSVDLKVLATPMVGGTAECAMQGMRMEEHDVTRLRIETNDRWAACATTTVKQANDMRMGCPRSAIQFTDL